MEATCGPPLSRSASCPALLWAALPCSGRLPFPVLSFPVPQRAGRAQQALTLFCTPCFHTAQAFGGAPGPSECAGATQTPTSREAAEGALEQWRHRETGNLLAAAAAAAEAEAEAEAQTPDGAGGKAVEKSAVSVTTVHSDGRSEAAQSP